MCPGIYSFASCFNFLLKNKSNLIELRSEFQAVKRFIFRSADRHVDVISFTFSSN